MKLSVASHSLIGSAFVFCLFFPLHVFADLGADDAYSRREAPDEVWNSIIGSIICSLLVVIAAITIFWICWWGVRARRNRSKL